MNPKNAAAVAAILWGFTYVVSTTMLPPHPVMQGAVRALGGALILLLVARTLVPRDWWGRVVVLGTLNAGLMFGLLFVAATRLPGGVAAIFQAMGPMAVILLGWLILAARPTWLALASVAIGAAGVSMVVLNGQSGFDWIGIAAALGAMLSLALGGVLMNKWGKPPIPLLGFTGWQLAVAGVQLLAVAALTGDWTWSLTPVNVLGFVILATAITALPFALWFRAIAGAGAVAVAPFFLLVPITAFVLDALVKGYFPTGLQMLGIAVVITGLLLSQWQGLRARRNDPSATPRTDP